MLTGGYKRNLKKQKDLVYLLVYKLIPIHGGLLLLLRRFSRVRLCDPMDCSLPGLSIHGVLQARTRVGCRFLLQCMKVKSER